MESSERVGAIISGFPGYDGDLERRRSDEFVRSYLGEALAALRVRYEGMSPPLLERLDALLLRVAFADPKSFATHKAFAVVQTAIRDTGAVAAQDIATVELANGAPSVKHDEVARYLDDVIAALDRRDAAMRAAAAQP